MSLLKKSVSVSSSVGEPLGLVPAAGPGAPIEIVFTFDTTGSMHRCLAEVRAKLGDTMRRLFADIPNLRVAVFAHGDYCDAGTYVTKYVDFTSDVHKLCDFVQKVGATSGGDWEECYELVLRQARQLLAWSPGTQRALVMIGDAVPHPATDPQNKDSIDWRAEAASLRDEMGVRVYSVQAYDNARARDFWVDLAKMTYGKHLNLGEFDTIVEMMMAICYREGGAEFFEAYEREVRAREGAGMRKDLDRMFNALRDGDAAPSTDPATSTAALRPTASVSALPLPALLSKGGAKRKTAASKVVKPKAALFKAKRAAASKKILKKAMKTSTDEDLITYRLGRQYRETVREASNEFSGLPWSKWRLALAPTAPEGAVGWIPRRSGAVGVRNTALDANVSSPAVYEIAVQTHRGRRLHPVYLRSTAAATHSGHWDTALLRNSRVNRMASDVLAKGCKLYVRRAPLHKPVTCNGRVAGSVAELRRLMRDTYDYAWAKSAVQSRCRTVSKGGVVISQ